jgi:hypothetical protein
MARQGKFAALQELRQSSEGSVPASVEAERGRGRPRGKRSNPEWKLYSHFLKRRTQREAVALLADEDEGRDLSDVLQGLLEGWIAQRRG